MKTILILVIHLVLFLPTQAQAANKVKEEHKPIEGLIAAPHTPFNMDGSINTEVVKNQFAYLKKNGVKGVFVLGTTGEGLLLTPDEREQIAEKWVQASAKDDFIVIIQVGDNSLATACRLAGHAQEIGADAIGIMPPIYFKPSSIDALVNFCSVIAASASQLPCYYYHIPSWTGVDLPMDQFLAEGKEKIPTLVGLKYSSNDLVQLQKCLAFDHASMDILFGCDEILLSALALGAKGAVGSSYNFAAPLYNQMIEAFKQDDLERARALQLQSVHIIEQIAQYGYLPASKAVMEMCGVSCGPVRAPLTSLDQKKKQALKKELSPYFL